MQRRQFLASSTTALFAAASLAADSPAPRVGLGFSLYGMKSLKIEDAIQACDKIGYDCVELPVMPGWPGDSAKLKGPALDRVRKALSDHGIRMSAIMENLPLLKDEDQLRENLVRLRRAGAIAKALAEKGAKPVVETILGGRPADWEKVKKRMADQLADWARVAEQDGFVVAIKAHVGGAMHRAEHPVWMSKRVGSPSIRCAYDFSHFQLRNEDLEKSLRELLPHSVFVHVKDGRGDAKNVRFLLPGEGNIDYPRYLGLVKQLGYRGDIVVEVSGQIHSRPGYDPIDAARKSYAPLAKAFRAAGLPRG